AGLLLFRRLLFLYLDVEARQAQGRAFGKERCFEGGKAWLIHFENAAGFGVLSSNNACGVNCIPIPTSNPTTASNLPLRLIMIWLYAMLASHESFFSKGYKR
ncbi:hypothetical protein Pfo_026468, partial [Paulownia fortunei]